MSGKYLSSRGMPSFLQTYYRGIFSFQLVFTFEAVDSIVFSCIDLAVTLFTSDTPKVFSGHFNNELIFIFWGEPSF